MKVWITQYCLTRGIEEKQTIQTEISRTIIRATNGIPRSIMRVFDEQGYVSYIDSPYWHTTLESAIAHAEIMRQKKIKSLEAQIEKIKNIRFEKHILS